MRFSENGSTLVLSKDRCCHTPIQEGGRTYPDRNGPARRDGTLSARLSLERPSMPTA